ncbi:MAG TPA: two-component sensor histidine kinase [Candidatus Nesterenkonia stercoripullorum]|uniref:Two-component sensor histidine kinase n=1 Tax=Candidatus Nesterenkonia stercoripullorum TaxID=2838701 RepID=A0A9D2A8Q1_9MICC|nr:two-component sensor histidine kinase [Candidatus Nesterenkonia stercoripullorum]
MDDHHSSAASSRFGRKPARRADEYSGLAMLGLCFGIGVITLVIDDLLVPVWTWAGLLLLWLVTVSLAATERLTRRPALVFYGCAAIISWALLLTTSSSGGMVVVLMVVVAAVGSFVIPIRWVLVLVLLNSGVTFLHSRLSDADPRESLLVVGFYLIIHLATVFSGYAMRQETELRTELEQKNLDLEAAAVLLEDSAASDERLRISRELHDLIGHQLTVLNLELEAAKHREGSQARAHVDQAAEVAKGLLADVRTTVGELRQDSQGDLRQSLQRLAGAVPSLDVHVEVDADVRTDEEIHSTLLRAAQEIITNTIKHAQAAELALIVTQEAGTLTLTGTNDGVAPGAITPGHGLTGLKERLEGLDGRLEIRTTPHFTVEAHLPVMRDRQLQT